IVSSTSWSLSLCVTLWPLSFSTLFPYTTLFRSLGLLPQRLVIQDDTADVVRQAWSRKQHFAIAAPCLLGPFEPDRLETLRDRAGRLVGSQDTFPFRSHAASDRLKFSAIHNSLQRIRADPTFAIACHARRFLGEIGRAH